MFGKNGTLTAIILPKKIRRTRVLKQKKKNWRICMKVMISKL